MKKLLFVISFFALAFSSIGQPFTSDYAQIKRSIKQEYQKWTQKNEFEKTVDYQNRIANNSSSAFDSICYSVLLQSFERKDRSGFVATLSNYDADTEKFGVEVSFSHFKFTDTLSVPVRDAEKFKKSFRDFNISGNEKDWKFVNYELVPSKVVFRNRYTHESFELSFNDKASYSITFSLAELDLNLPNEQKNKFDLEQFYDNNILEKKVFQERNRAAINNIAFDKLLKKDFAKALEILTKGLSITPKNDESYPYLLSNLGHAYLFTNQYDIARKIYFENLNLKLAGEDWKTTILKDFNTFREAGILSFDMEKMGQELASLKEDDIVYEKVDIEASVDQAQWIKNLQARLPHCIEEAKAKGMITGTYTVKVKFLVERDGSLTDVQALNDPGFGLAKSAVDAVKEGPKWNPSILNGKPVRSFHTQPITFTIGD